ncbi:MAG: hypothetical protein ABSE86_37380 [Bryobacteraceae bacterium]|jgi:hypothetical protein
MSEVPQDSARPSRQLCYRANDAVEVAYDAGAPIRISGRVREISDKVVSVELRSAVGRGISIRITFQAKLVIFGEVRLCTRSDDHFRAEIVVQDMIRSSSSSDQHLEDGELSQYLAGEGLAVPEVIALHDHLAKCEECSARLDRLAPGR